VRRHLIRLCIAVSLLATAFVLPSPAQAGPLVFKASEDATVAEEDPSDNFGDDTVLLSDRDPEMEALLQFNVDQLDGTVSFARLRLWVLNSTSNGPEVWRSETFEEDTVTWNSRPSRSSRVADLGSVSKGRWIEIDVTSTVTGTGTYAFTLVPDSTDGADFTSAEGSSNQPELVVETASSSSSSSTTASTSGPTSTTSSSTTTTAPQSTSGPFRAVADTFVEEDHPDRTAGSASEIEVDASPDNRALLRFVIPSGASTSAGYKLRLWVTNSTSNGPKVWTTGSFDEATARWSNKPSLGRMIADFGSVSSGRWVEIDVTGEVNGPGTYNLALVADSTDGADFASRESGSNAPQIVTGSAPTSTTTGPTTTTTSAPTTTTTTSAPTTTTTSGATTTTSSSTTTTRPPSSGSTFEIGVIGDTGYKPEQVDGLEDSVADMNRLNMTFALHAGDIWGGGTSCSDSKFKQMRDIFNDFDEAFVYVPGDNEWDDCSVSSSGRLSFIRDTFFPTSKSLGRAPITVSRQSGQPENQMWVYQGIVFATMNEPGSSGASGTMKDKNLDWMDKAFDEAERIDAPGVLIMFHDNPFKPSGGALYRLLEDRTEEFGRPVTLVHGDTHSYKVDHPWSSLPKFTRVETFGGSADGEWVRITVDPNSSSVFSFKRETP
jgi:hypothetical protein